MQTARISALLEPFLTHPLSDQQLNQISTYIDLLQRWNARINLTAIRNEEEIVARHFGESLFLAHYLFPKKRDTGHQPLTTGNCPHVLDIGSGAGFPALPIKIWEPSIRLTLVESNHKKAAFLREAARGLTLTNINVITERAETLIEEFRTHPESQPHVVTLRAVEHFESTLQTAATLLPPTGRLAILIGTTQLPHLTTIPALSWNDPIHVPGSLSRQLLIGIQMKSGV